MSSYSWKNNLTPNQNDSKVLPRQSNRDNVSDVSDSSASSNPKKVIKTEKQADKKRRKIKKAKEEKEDGELDDDNDDVNSQGNEDEYEYYDSDESNKQLSLSKKIDEPLKKEPEKVPAPPPLLQTIPEATFSITNPYDSEYEDYDSDDDDYGNNKRLKIDESEDLPEEKPSDLVNPSIDLIKPKEFKTNKKENNNDIINITVDKIKPINDESRHIEIENDNSTSSAASTKSNSSSSELNAISRNFTESAAYKPPLQDQNITKKDAKPEETPRKSSEIKNEKDSQPYKSVSNNENSKSPSSESNTNSDTNEKASDDSKQQKKEGTEDDNKTPGCLKVPSLKIIFSNSNGGHPYVKAPPNGSVAADKLGKNGKLSNSSKKEELAVNGEVSSTFTTPTKQTNEAQNLNIQDSPANNSRAKSSRSSRVSSPVATSYKSTPTRRSAAAVAAAALSTAGRSSPSSAYSRAQAAAAEIASSSSSSSSSSIMSASNQSGDPDTPGTRRKLRSHTRLGVDELPAIGRVQNSSAMKSPSPLTVQSENSVNSNEMDQSTSTSEVKAPQTTTEASEHSNSSVIDSDSALPTLSTPLPPLSTTLPPLTTTLTLSDFLPTRKKRNRQQQQELQEQLDLINEIEGLNALAASSMHSHDGLLKSDGTCPNGCDKSLNDSNDERYQPSLFNCIKKFIDLRNDVTMRRETLMKTRIDVKLPKNFNEFILNRKSYLIRFNKEARKLIPFLKPPNDIPEVLKEFFSKQEKERYSLRIRHQVEQDKLIILYEQEILRCFNKSAREAVNQTVPFSFCSMIKDDEIYSQFRISERASLSATTAPSLINTEASNSEQTKPSKEVQEEQMKQVEEKSSQSKPACDAKTTDEDFLNKLDGLKDKFQKLKNDIIKRQLIESDSLHGVQKMNFQSKLRELSNKYKNAATNSTNPTQTSPSTNANLAAASLTTYNIISQFKQNDLHVPIVQVNHKFNLLDVPQQQHFIPNSSPSNSTSVSIFA